ncbi:hypothetical protein O3P69_006781 [Scylla paramamosain]|uniref:Cleavage and polyadenylation specificity factor subunit 2 n=1 Tax=Scylla paramamosain TaxID=85552 RepID=A0AAW0U173_SCYPA
MTSIVNFEGIWGVGKETPHCYLLTVDDFTFLLDCGVLPRVDCVLISYPDPLHMGALPYMSHHNYDLVEHFCLDDVDAAFDLITQVKYNQSIPMRGKGIGLSISAQPAGHMIGGAIWRIIKDGEGDIVYAVDFNHKKECHLGGCKLDKISRSSLLTTDAFNSSYWQERRRHRDEKLVAQLQETCCNGGNVLMWNTKESGLSAYSLAILSNTVYHVIHFAKQMIEWISENFKHLKFCHNLIDLSHLPSPKVVLASFPDLESGYSRELFVQWATNPKNTIILTSRVECSSDSEDDEGLQAGKHDIIVLHEKAGNQSMFQSCKHYPLFPYHEDKVRGDDYGEFINLEDFEISGLKEENKENIDLQIPYDDDDMMARLWQCVPGGTLPASVRKG